MPQPENHEYCPRVDRGLVPIMNSPAEGSPAAVPPLSGAPPNQRRPERRSQVSALDACRCHPVSVGAVSALAVLLRGLGISATAAVAWALAFGLCSVLIMAVLSRKYGGLVHCTAFCPMGLVVNVLERLSPRRIRVDSARCGNCGACEKTCRYAAITPESRAMGKTLLRCSLCRDCVSTCPHGAITLRCPGLPPQAAWNLFAGLPAVLHALFLAVAMV